MGSEHKTPKQYIKTERIIKRKKSNSGEERSVKTKVIQRGLSNDCISLKKDDRVCFKEQDEWVDAPTTSREVKATGR